MTLLECLERDKERLLSGLVEASDPKSAIAVLEKEADRLLLVYNEACEEEMQRDAAAGMLSAVRLCAPFINSDGAISVWETDAGSDISPKKTGIGELIFLGLSGLCGVGAFATALSVNLAAPRATDLILSFLLAAAAPVLAFFGGKKAPGKISLVKGKDVTYKTEVKVDAERIYRVLYNTVYAIDRSLDGLPDYKKSSQSNAGTDTPGAIPPALLDLLSGLLEACYSGDGEYALDRLCDVKLYLHRNKVEALDFDGTNKEHFDFLPSGERKTIRPALVSEGRVIKRGLAAGR